MGPGDSLTLQVTTSAARFHNSGSIGLINVSDMQLSLPTVADGAAMIESSTAFARVSVAWRAPDFYTASILDVLGIAAVRRRV